LTSKPFSLTWEPKEPTAIEDRALKKASSHQTVDIRTRRTTEERLSLALEVLTVARRSLTAVDALKHEVSRKPLYLAKKFFAEGGGLQSLLSWCRSTYPDGFLQCIPTEFKNDAVEVVCQTVYAKMDAVKDKTRLAANDITPEYIRDWNVGQHSEIAPTLFRVLRAAAQTQRAQ
jgi:hypothetical protein